MSFIFQEISKSSTGADKVMVIIKENGHCDPSSNHVKGWNEKH